MNPGVKTLIPAIASYVTEQESYLTKTKLLKLLYLFDVEYYRIHRETFSGFRWKFFHLGPWTNEFEAVLDDLVAEGVLIESLSSKPEFETKFYKSSETVGIDKLFIDYKDEAALRLILSRWGDSSTGEILDHVYFRTEPMEHGVRNEPLDFTVIAEQAPPRYVKSSSGKTPKEIEVLRKKFREQTALWIGQKKSSFAFTPPRYDTEFFEAMSKLDEASH